jgi:hypothetical protein
MCRMCGRQKAKMRKEKGRTQDNKADKRNTQVMPSRSMRVMKVKRREKSDKTRITQCTQDTQMRALQYLHLWPHTRLLLVTRGETRPRTMEEEACLYVRSTQHDTELTAAAIRTHVPCHRSSLPTLSSFSGSHPPNLQSPRPLSLQHERLPGGQGAFPK